VTLWVVRIVPWAVLAAVAAISIPQRMAAESSMRSATEDLAKLLNNELNAARSAGDLSADGFSLTALCMDRSAGEDPRDEDLCAAVGSVLRDLGTAGVNADSLRGFYVHEVEQEVDRVGTGSSRSSPRWFLCEDPDGGTAGGADGLYVALVGDWSGGGWAPAQIWPHGRSVGGEALRSETLTRAAECPDDWDGVDPGRLDRSGTVAG